MAYERPERGANRAQRQHPSVPPMILPAQFHELRRRSCVLIGSPNACRQRRRYA